MKTQYPLFSQIALAEDLPGHHFKRGDIATAVEHYSMPDEEDNGYSSEGFGILNVTVEVAASQIISVNQLQREEEPSNKLHQLSQFKLL